MEIRVNNQYRLGPKIGAGATGVVHRGTDLTTNEAVAIKLELLESSSRHLELERQCYEAVSNELGIPRMRWYGAEGEYQVLVMDLLGNNLEELLMDCEYKFSLRTVLMLAGQMITRIEALHRHGFLHCDIKPSNFAVGRGDQQSCIYLIDFGLAKRYINPTTGEHIRQSRSSYAGTDRYASLNTHCSIVPSRRDDLESLAYTLIYFLAGRLPWQNMKARNSRQKRQRIYEKKINTSVEELCRGMPSVMATFIRYTRNLKFDEAPNYDYLRNLCWDLFDKRSFSYEDKWDWDNLPPPEETISGEFNWASNSWRRAIHNERVSDSFGAAIRNAFASGAVCFSSLAEGAVPSEGSGEPQIVPLTYSAIQNL